uniref:Uncharacterized protein n=1 Tax=Panagrolaimus davidi TaxID=227884 RepID=A0A914Q0F4_9BILA
MPPSRRTARQALNNKEGNAEEQQRPPPEKRKKSIDSYNYCTLLGIDAVPENVPTTWCKCHECPTREIPPKDAICCSMIRESDTELAENWFSFIGEFKGCYATHPKIQNLIKNKEELDSFMIIDGIRKMQIAEEGGRDPIRGYCFTDRQAGYRFACYRKITMLVHQRFGAENYVTTPACIVEAIRKLYPSNQCVVRNVEV